MSGSDETRTITGWRQASRYYRRTPGAGWLLALFVIPLLLGLLGWAVLDKSKTDVELTLPSVSPSMTVPALTTPEVSPPGLRWTPLSLMRNGNDFTLVGVFPDLAAKTSLIDTLRQMFGPGANVVDNTTIEAGSNVPDLSGIGGVFKAAVDIPDFGWTVDGDTIVLTGIAPTSEVKAAEEAAAKTAWPNAKIDNQIRVNDLNVATSAPATPTGPAASAGGCTALQTDINALLRTPINFDTDGYGVAASSQQMLTQVADKIKACPDSRIAVRGFTDNTGSDAINQPLSESRAKSVADFLVSQGVAAANVTSQGLGSADPVAGNDTAEGRAANRRVEIAVS
jgi:peptidoglycan-binding protein ArfA